jgi:hypothetical protein
MFYELDSDNVTEARSSHGTNRQREQLLGLQNAARIYWEIQGVRGEIKRAEKLIASGKKPAWPDHQQHTIDGWCRVACAKQTTRSASEK